MNTCLIAVERARRHSDLLIWLVQLLHRNRHRRVIHVELSSGLYSVGAWYPEGVGERPIKRVLDRYANNGNTIWAVPSKTAFDSITGPAYLRCRRDVGKPYDMAGALNAGIDWLERFGLGIALDDPRKAFCSQLVARGLRLDKPEEQTPSEIAAHAAWDWDKAVGLKTWLDYLTMNPVAKGTI